MTAQATQVVLAVCGTRKVCVILPRSMALQATFVYRLWGSALEAEDLGLVPTTLNVVLARTMATLTTLFGCATALIQQRFPMR